MNTISRAQTQFFKHVLELEKLEAALKKQRGYSTELEQQMQKTQVEMEVSLRNEQQTISLLVSEKAALTSGLERLSGAESCTVISLYQGSYYPHSFYMNRCTGDWTSAL